MNTFSVIVLLCFLCIASAANLSDRRNLLKTTKKKSRTLAKLEACSGKSIYILDLNDFAKENDIPTCDLAKDVKVDPGNGLPFLPDAPGLLYLPKGAPIELGAYSAPWLLHEAVRNSAYVTTDMDRADIVLLYDYCYYARWLGQVHTIGTKAWNEESQSGEWLIKGYNSVFQLDRWKKNNGADFVIFDPHPGFMDGRTDEIYKNYTCNIMRNAMHIVAERGQRNTCKEYWTLHKKLTIAPYVAGSADMAKPLLGFNQPVLPLSARKTLLHFRAGCLPYGYFYPNQTKIATGKVLRHAAALALGSEAPDIDVHCTDKYLAGQHKSFADVVQTMRSSLFCPALPGDSASARRTSEIFMAGCIPVFIGPPYGTMPFPDEVDYKRASLIFNITEHRQWLDSEMFWENPKDVRPVHVQNPWYWSPDADVKGSIITVKTMQDMVKYLREIPKPKLQEMLNAVALERQKFAWRPKLVSKESASGIVLSRMCSMKTNALESI